MPRQRVTSYEAAQHLAGMVIGQFEYDEPLVVRERLSVDTDRVVKELLLLRTFAVDAATQLISQSIPKAADVESAYFDMMTSMLKDIGALRYCEARYEVYLWVM